MTDKSLSENQLQSATGGAGQKEGQVIVDGKPSGKDVSFTGKDNKNIGKVVAEEGSTVNFG